MLPNKRHISFLFFLSFFGKCIAKVGKKVVGYLPSLGRSHQEATRLWGSFAVHRGALILLCVIALLLTIGRKENQKPRSDYS